MRFVKIVGPSDSHTFEMSVKNTLQSLLKDNKGKHIVKLDVLVNSAHQQGFNEEKDYIEETIKTVFKNKVPAFSILYTPICNGNEFTVQYQMYDMDAQVEYKTLLQHHYVTVKNKVGLEVFSGGISFNEDSLLFSAQRCFDLAEQILMAEDMNFGHIYRQWNFIPNLNQNTEGSHTTKNVLSVFKEVKGFYYEEPLFINGKPINTDTHNFNDTLLIDFVAFAVDADNSESHVNEDIAWLSNYTDLKTKWVFDGKPELWFTSLPTLAITSPHDKNNLSQKPDIEKQTIQKLKHLVELMDTSRAHRNTDGKLNFIKVSIKQGQDYKKVEELIQSSLPQIQTLFVNSIPNHPDSLIEMEGLIS